MTCSLSEILKYKNIHVLNRYQKDFPHAIFSAEETFKELLKYIWLTATHDNERKNNPLHPALDFRCLMHEEMIDIDNMWHTFLLFTKDYHDFCKHYLQDGFLHHYPLIDEEKQQSASDYKNELDRYLSYIYDHLGAETLRKWFLVDLTDMI
jgi:hypothetical protein